jgi:hypothetical protein
MIAAQESCGELVAFALLCSCQRPRAGSSKR